VSGCRVFYLEVDWIQAPHDAALAKYSMKLVSDSKQQFTCHRVHPEMLVTPGCATRLKKFIVRQVGTHIGEQRDKALPVDVFGRILEALECVRYVSRDATRIYVSLGTEIEDPLEVTA
jgi:hypothetical protein